MAFDRTNAGRRVRIIRLDDQYTKLRPGDEGEVQFADDYGHLHVAWDDGSNLSLLPDVDHFEWVDAGEVSER